MMPQSTFMVTAAVESGQLEALRALLKTLTHHGGMADPENTLVPFAQFDRLHMARFFIAEAVTGDDIAVYGVTPVEWPPTLVFLGDCDGPTDRFLAELVARAGPGLRQIFSFCTGFSPEDSDLLAWMKAHNKKPAANYINWIGRTVVQAREEADLHEALAARLKQAVAELGADDTRRLRQDLLSFIEFERQQGRLRLTPVPPTPPGWAVRNFLHLVGVPLALLILSPLLLVIAPFAVFYLRLLERSDPEVIPPHDLAHLSRLATDEDHDVSNQFSAFGDVKPGLFRRYLTMFILVLIDYAARHIYKRGFLARVRTIHFARWVFLDGRRRVFFASNYDGGHEAYMDDFINKVAFGLNLVFSNGVGYPRSRWLVKGGAELEQKFKYYQRRHQLVTDVWYKAYPGKTAFDLDRNSRIRDGVENRQENDAEIREWLSLL